MWTKYTSVLHRTVALIRPILPLVVGIALFVVFTGSVYAVQGDATNQFLVSSPLAQESDSDPEANLSFLFAVYIITWAGFFGYVFYVSRRQREMRREIDALKRAVHEKEETAS